MNLATLTVRGPSAYDDVKATNTAQAFGGYSNPAYSTFNRNARDDNKFQEDPVYATPDILRMVPDVEANPCYEIPDVQNKKMNTFGHSTFGGKDPNPDIKRFEVNGDLYTVPNKGSIKVKVFRLT